MLRVIYGFIIMIFVLLLITDILYVNTAYSKAEKAVEQAIDSAIIAGTESQDLQRGKITINKTIASQEGHRVLQNTLKLDQPSSPYKNIQYNFTITYANELPRVEIEFKSFVAIKSGKIFGLNEYEMVVQRKTPYLSQFK
jgi:Flp pilus assembly protein TadG